MKNIIKNKKIGILAGVIFTVVIMWLAFCNGENIGRFIYVTLH